MSERKFEYGKQRVWCQACKSEALVRGTVDDGPFVLRISCECGAFFQFTIPEGKAFKSDEVWDQFKRKATPKFVPAERYLGKTYDEIEALEGSEPMPSPEKVAADLNEILRRMGAPKGIRVMADGTPEAEAAKKNPNMVIKTVPEFLEMIKDRHESGQCGCSRTTAHDHLLDEEPKGKA